MFYDSFSIRKFEKYYQSLTYMYIANLHVHIYKYIIMCLHSHMHLDFLTSAAQTKVEFALCLGQYVVEYMCISNLSTTIYYCSKLETAKLN